MMLQAADITQGSGDVSSTAYNEAAIHAKLQEKQARKEARRLRRK